MKNVQDRIIKLEKKVDICIRYLRGQPMKDWLREELDRELLMVDKKEEKKPVIVKKCWECRYYWHTKDGMGCSYDDRRYVYPHSKKELVETQNLLCEDFKKKPSSGRFLRPGMKV